MQGSHVHNFSCQAAKPLHPHLPPDPGDLQLSLGQLGLSLHQTVGGSQAAGRAGAGVWRTRNPPVDVGHSVSNKITLSWSLLGLGIGQVHLDDPSLHDGVVEPDDSVVSIPPPGHGDEPEALAPLVIVDDLGVLHVAHLAKEHDQVVFPEILQSSNKNQ